VCALTPWMTKRKKCILAQMKAHRLLFGGRTLRLELPEWVDVLTMGEVEPLADPPAAIRRALAEPIGTESLSTLAGRVRAAHPEGRAVVVVSDHTRPVPYKGESGILWPVVQTLLEAGFAPSGILVLVATGTHAPLSEAQLRGLFDSRVFEARVRVQSHDARDTDMLVPLGTTKDGMEVLIDRRYADARLRVLTGLVESHFIAGVSGGRKAICPGLVGESTTYRFHSPQVMASPEARDLNLEGNPCHELALEAAHMAGTDFTVNVTLDKHYQVTGVFAGELEMAHLAAFDFLKSYVSVPFRGRYDLVITHGGAVGVNHYQSVKAALAALPAIRAGGTMLVAAANTDPHPVGSERYRSLLHLLTLVGAQRFRRLIFSPDWTFVPEQWEVQAWASVLERVGEEGLVYYSPQVGPVDSAVLPGVDGNGFLPETQRFRPDSANLPTVVRGVLEAVRQSHQARAGTGSQPRAAFLADGPYGILVPDGSPG
jgi:nickel-dependent lactate racemase